MAVLKAEAEFREFQEKDKSNLDLSLYHTEKSEGRIYK